MTTDSKRPLRVLISGGGTGGHIFPALSIANALKDRDNAEILFVGADNRMEMERVPAAGYEIIGLPVAGFDRKRLWRNIGVLFKLWKSMRKARRIVRGFRPDIAVGVGGYASGPTLKAAQKAGVPTLLQEQNSYAGVTNKLLAAKAARICVAYPGMERFFPSDRIEMTGNPVRKDILRSELSVEKARESFGLDPGKPVALFIGGSLGALTINESVEASLRRLIDAGLQVIWQTGKSFIDRAHRSCNGMKGVVATAFVTDMAAAYRAATVVVSRAGAGTISELELLGKPAILVPSPNVAEDHQTKNAMALSSKGAAVLVTDADARRDLAAEVLALAADGKRRESMRKAIEALALPDADVKIAEEIEKITGREK